MNYLTFKLIYTAFKLFLFMSYFNMGYIRLSDGLSLPGHCHLHVLHPHHSEDAGGRLESGLAAAQKVREENHADGNDGGDGVCDLLDAFSHRAAGQRVRPAAQCHPQSAGCDFGICQQLCQPHPVRIPVGQLQTLLPEDFMPPLVGKRHGGAHRLLRHGSEESRIQCGGLSAGQPGIG